MVGNGSAPSLMIGGASGWRLPMQLKQIRWGRPNRLFSRFIDMNQLYPFGVIFSTILGSIKLTEVMS
jgi:hypothetical protein